MAKGRRGCFTCGAPTVVTVQVWLRDYTGERYANGCRKQKTVGSISRSFCWQCSKEPWITAASIVRSFNPARWGCGKCEQPTQSRLQVSMRTVTGESGRSVTGSFCEDCSLDVYDAAIALLDPDSWKPDYHVTSPTGLTAARAASLAS